MRWAVLLPLVLGVVMGLVVPWLTVPGRGELEPAVAGVEPAATAEPAVAGVAQAAPAEPAVAGVEPVAPAEPAVAGPWGAAVLAGAAQAGVAALEPHYALIRASQRASGAIAMTPMQLDINPYFANLAARSLLWEPGQLERVERYMAWYLGRLNPDGTIDDYRVEAGGEVALGKYDSADSYAATFLSLVDAYLGFGGDPEWVRQQRPDLERVAGVMVQLTDEDGLTWVKAYYPLKLLMDNVEVWQGWEAWARVLERLDDQAGAAQARERAAAVVSALDRFRRPDGRYAWGLAPLGIRRGGNLDRFYPDAVAQFFPFALGLTDDPEGYWAFARAHPQWAELESDRFPWIFAGVAAARAGDQKRVEQALAAAAAKHPDLGFPWYVGESAWVIELYQGVEPVASYVPARRGPRPE